MSTIGITAVLADLLVTNSFDELPYIARSLVEADDAQSVSLLATALAARGPAGVLPSLWRHAALALVDYSHGGTSRQQEMAASWNRVVQPTAAMARQTLLQLLEDDAPFSRGSAIALVGLGAPPAGERVDQAYSPVIRHLLSQSARAALTADEQAVVAAVLRLHRERSNEPFILERETVVLDLDANVDTAGAGDRSDEARATLNLATEVLLAVGAESTWLDLMAQADGEDSPVFRRAIDMAADELEACWWQRTRSFDCRTTPVVRGWLSAARAERLMNAPATMHSHLPRPGGSDAPTPTTFAAALAMVSLTDMRQAQAILQGLVKCGADLDAGLSWTVDAGNTAQTSRFTLLLKAVEAAAPQLVAELLAAGCDPRRALVVDELQHGVTSTRTRDAFEVLSASELTNALRDEAAPGSSQADKRARAGEVAALLNSWTVRGLAADLISHMEGQPRAALVA